MHKQSNELILDVKDLEVDFSTYGGSIHAVRGVNFELHKGEVLAIVGESGCGKSVTAQTIMRLIPMPPGRIVKGRIMFDGKYDLAKISDKAMEQIRGSEIGMIFQDPMTSLNPTMTVGSQIAESLIKHQNMARGATIQQAIELLRLVGIPSAEARVRQYPHELSGGMRQRVMIALAMACRPKLLIADEPTTALDVTIQAQIIDLMKDLQQKLSMSIILITHDLGVVADIAQRVVVMYAGRIVEKASVTDLFYRPRHPYTWGLLRSMPRVDRNSKEPLIPIEGTPPDLFAPPKGCPFGERCPYAMGICLERDPEHMAVGKDHTAACWLLHPEAPKIAKPIETEGRKYG